MQISEILKLLISLWCSLENKCYPGPHIILVTLLYIRSDELKDTLNAIFAHVIISRPAIVFLFFLKITKKLNSDKKNHEKKVPNQMAIPKAQTEAKQLLYF